MKSEKKKKRERLLNDLYLANLFDPLQVAAASETNADVLFCRHVVVENRGQQKSLYPPMSIHL